MLYKSIKTYKTDKTLEITFVATSKSAPNGGVKPPWVPCPAPLPYN